MATKAEKAKDINTAIKRSAEARDVDAKAELIDSKRIEYSMIGKTPTGRSYRMRISFNKVLSLLWGEDMRRLKKKYGR